MTAWKKMTLWVGMGGESGSSLLVEKESSDPKHSLQEHNFYSDVDRNTGSFWSH